MNVTNHKLVLVRGINTEWFKENISQLWIGFGGSPQAIPKDVAYYVGLYLELPVSRITHIRIVDYIEKYDTGVDYYLNAIVKLKVLVDPGHVIGKHENWTLTRLRLNQIQIEKFDFFKWLHQVAV